MPMCDWSSDVCFRSRRVRGLETLQCLTLSPGAKNSSRDFQHCSPGFCLALGLRLSVPLRGWPSGMMITLFWKQCHPLAWKTLCCCVLRSLKTDCLVSVLTLISCMTLGSHSASLGFSFLITLGCSVVSNSFPPQGLQPARLLCPWNSPGKNTSVGSHSLLQRIFPTQGSNPWEIFTVLTVFFAV